MSMRSDFLSKESYIYGIGKGCDASEERCDAAGVGCSDADGFGDGRSDAVNGDGCADGLGLASGAEEDDGERNVGVSEEVVLSGGGVDVVPARCDFNEDVSGEFGMIGSAHAAHAGRPSPLHEARGGRDVFHSGEL